MNNKDYLNIACLLAYSNSLNEFSFGGPFGAVIVLDGKIIAKAKNTVLKKHDATCHAEINAIRKASRKLHSHDLSKCILYTSCYPCPMCLSAIIWANIKKVYYFNTKNEADKIGFRDEKIYKVLNNGEDFCEKLDVDDGNKAFDAFSKNKRIY